MKNRLLKTVVILGMALLANVAISQPLTVSEWQTIQKAKPKGNAELGKKLYQEKSCTGCHGINAIADNPEVPVLAGQRNMYIYKALLDYQAERVGSDNAAQMTGYTTTLSEIDMANLAEWLAGLKRPLASQQAVDRPEILKGDHKRLLPPCASCHGANGQGWEIQPALMGQNRDFLVAKLRCLKQGDCENDINESMRQFARKLTEEEINAIAKFYSR